MRLIDKLKRKLKVKTFLYKHIDVFLFAVGGPPGLVYLFLAPFFPFIGLIGLVLYGLIIGIGGFDNILNEEKRKFKLQALTEHIDALQGCSQETIVEINEQIKDVQKSIDKEFEVKKNKQLISALIERKKLVKQSIKEDYGTDISIQNNEISL